MASIPCPTRQNRPGCPCDDSPLANLTSELSDGPIFIGYRPQPPIYNPQPGNPTSPEAPVFCISDISQEAADLCADNGTVPAPYVPPTPNPTNPIEPPQPPDTPPGGTGDPNIPGPPPPGPPPEPAGFWNTESNCIAFCPDNVSSATASIPAHTILGASQAEADMLASNACIALARSRLVCFTPPSEGTIVHICADVPATINCVVTGQVTSIEMTGLPAGMSFSCADTGICSISGTPSCGNYTVTVSVTPVLSPPTSFTFEIQVLGIACTAVSAEQGNPYSASVSACGGTAPYTFTPVTVNGLSLAANGAITGIAGTCPSAEIPVTVTDANGYTCSKTCSIAITLCSCPAFGFVTPVSVVQEGYGGGQGIVHSAFAASASCVNNPPASAGHAYFEASAARLGDCLFSLEIRVTGSGGNNCYYTFTMNNVNNPANPCAPTTVGLSAQTASWGPFQFRTLAAALSVEWTLDVEAGPQAPGLGGGDITVQLIFTNIDTSPCPP